MSHDLSALLPQLLPAAIAWAQSCEAAILAEGEALDEPGLALAEIVGVRRPERVRVQHIPAIPWPKDPVLRQAAIHTGLLGPGVGGLTLGHGIYIVGGPIDGPSGCHPRLLSHECRHVHQYEVAGSIGAFLKVYLRQVIELGYSRCPYEIDARNWERDA